MFTKGNKYAQQWTLENALPRFEDALNYAQTNDECLCLQDAKYVSAIPSRTFDYLVENHDVLRIIKEDIQDAIVRRINKLALQDLAPASPAIWRMKQLGERDEQHLHTTGTTKTEITVTSKEAKEEINKLMKDFDSE